MCVDVCVCVTWIEFSLSKSIQGTDHTWHLSIYIQHLILSTTHIEVVHLSSQEEIFSEGMIHPGLDNFWLRQVILSPCNPSA